MNNRLEAFENYLECDLADASKALDGLEDDRVIEICDNLHHLDSQWMSPEPKDLAIGSVLNSHVYFNKGVRMIKGGLRFEDPQYFAKLALYYDKILIHLKEIPTYAESLCTLEKNLMATKNEDPYVAEFIDLSDTEGNHEAVMFNLRSSLKYELEVISKLGPLLRCGALEIMPKNHNALVTEDDIVKTTLEDRDNPALRAILDRFDPYSDVLTTVGGWYDYDDLVNSSIRQYSNSLHFLNEDIAACSMTNSEMICSTKLMFELLGEKLKQLDKVDTLGNVWSSEVLSAEIFQLGNIDFKDLINMRANEEVFSEWRASLRKSLRLIRLELSSGKDLQPSDIKDIINAEFIDAARSLNDKGKSKSYFKAAKDSAVTFGIGAMSALTINPSPYVAVATGGMSASLKLLYSLLTDSLTEEDKSIARIYTLFSTKQ